MFEKYDLDEVAEALFSIRTSEKLEYERLLIRAKEKAVMPLLRAVLFVIARQKNMTEDLARSGKSSNYGEDGARYMWALATLEPVIDDVTNITHRIGKPATFELCKALRNPNSRIQLTATIILCKGILVSSEVHQAAQNALNKIGLDKKQGATLMLLGAILAKNGDQKWRSFIEDDARKYGISFDEWVGRTINTGLIELQKHK